MLADTEVVVARRGQLFLEASDTIACLLSVGISLDALLALVVDPRASEVVAERGSRAGFNLTHLCAAIDGRHRLRRLLRSTRSSELAAGGSDASLFLFEDVLSDTGLERVSVDDVAILVHCVAQLAQHLIVEVHVVDFGFCVLVTLLCCATDALDHCCGLRPHVLQLGLDEGLTLGRVLDGLRGLVQFLLPALEVVGQLLEVGLVGLDEAVVCFLNDGEELLALGVARVHVDVDRVEHRLRLLRQAVDRGLELRADGAVDAVLQFLIEGVVSGLESFRQFLVLRRTEAPLRDRRQLVSGLDCSCSPLFRCENSLASCEGACTHDRTHQSTGSERVDDTLLGVG